MALKSAIFLAFHPVIFRMIWINEYCSDFSQQITVLEKPFPNNFTRNLPSRKFFAVSPNYGNLLG